MRERQPDVESPFGGAPLRTGVARELTTLADEVTDCFEGFHVGSGDYVVELMAPEGDSTGGGAQSLQHIRLRPRKQGHAVVIAGSVNPVEKHAELRTFEHAFLFQQVRFAKPLEITVAEWERLLRKAEDVLQLANIEVARVGPSPDLLREARQTKSGRRVSSRALAVFLVVLVLALAVAALVVKKLLAG